MKGLLTFLFYIVFPIIILVFLFWLGWGGGFGEKHTLFVKELYNGNIGSISVKSQPIERDFTVVNKSKDTVIISKIYTDCKCLSVVIPLDEQLFGTFEIPTEENTKPLQINIGSGEQILIKLTFDPANALRSNFYGNIFVEILKSGEILKIPITADIVE